MEGDTQGIRIQSLSTISIHALRVEGDHMHPEDIKSAMISIHALRVEGDFRSDVPTSKGTRISIHALRVESDRKSVCMCAPLQRISIHALRVESDSKNGQSFRLFLRKREKNLPL